MLHTSAAALLAFERGMSEQPRHQQHLQTSIHQALQPHKPLSLHYSSPPETTSYFGLGEEQNDEKSALNDGNENEFSGSALPASYAAVAAGGVYGEAIPSGSGVYNSNGDLASQRFHGSLDDMKRAFNSDGMAGQHSQQFLHPAAKKDKLTMLLEERVPDNVSSFMNDSGMMSK